MHLIPNCAFFCALNSKPLSYGDDDSYLFSDRDPLWNDRLNLCSQCQLKGSTESECHGRVLFCFDHETWETVMPFPGRYGVNRRRHGENSQSLVQT